MTKMSKFKFYFLSFTWGLPVTVLGLIMALICLICGKKPKKWGYCWYFEVGKCWGGTELGIFFIKDSSDSVHIKNHEHGHALQNCYWGFLMIPVISLPSFLRYWYRRIIVKIKKDKKLPPYDSIWFEGQATRLGTEFIKNKYPEILEKK